MAVFVILILHRVLEHLHPPGDLKGAFFDNVYLGHRVVFSVHDLVLEDLNFLHLAGQFGQECS